MSKPKKFGIQISMRLPEDLHGEVARHASKMIRSMNEQAIYWIKLGMENDPSYAQSQKTS